MSPGIGGGGRRTTGVKFFGMATSEAKTVKATAISIAGCELSFSKLKLTLTYLRASMQWTK